MTLRRLLIVLTATVATGCGATDRFALTTPGTDGATVTAEEREILRHWGEQLRLDDPTGASRDFGVPAYVSDGDSGWVELADRQAIERFNDGFTCGATLVDALRRPDGFVVGTFQLVEQAGVNRCGARTGQLRVIAVKIEGHRISQWRQDRTESPGAVA